MNISRRRPSRRARHDLVHVTPSGIKASAAFAPTVLVDDTDDEPFLSPTFYDEWKEDTDDAIIICDYPKILDLAPRPMPRAVGVPRKAFTSNGITRKLIESSPEPTSRGQRCAWCGWWGPQDNCMWAWCDESIELYRVFPGPRFITDGYVNLCTRCRPEVIPDHMQPTSWAGAATLEPVPDCPIEVLAYKYADDARVASFVRRVWNAVPETGRRRILEYLDADQRELVYDQPQVAVRKLRIEAVPRWPIFGRLLGCNMASGHVIRLWATAAKDMNERALAALVAHELAHTYQHAIGTMLYGGDADFERQVETEAEEIAARWGFPDDDMGEWIT